MKYVIANLKTLLLLSCVIALSSCKTTLQPKTSNPIILLVPDRIEVELLKEDLSKLSPKSTEYTSKKNQITTLEANATKLEAEIIANFKLVTKTNSNPAKAGGKRSVNNDFSMESDIDVAQLCQNLSQAECELILIAYRGNNPRPPGSLPCTDAKCQNWLVFSDGTACSQCPGDRVNGFTFKGMKGMNAKFIRNLQIPTQIGKGAFLRTNQRVSRTAN